MYVTRVNDGLAVLVEAHDEVFASEKTGGF
jgi:hypothetical protein